jgi:hypothetical protein
MFNALLKIVTMMVAFFKSPFKAKKKIKPIKLPKNYNDTSDARYAINENGYLEEIHHDRLSNQTLN